MLRDLYRDLRAPLLSAYYIARFGGLWNLKRHIQSQRAPDPRMLAAYERYLARFGSWIGYNAEFAGEPCFPHGLYGVFVSGGARVGRNAVIFHQVTIGSNTLRGSDRTGSPVIGDNVYIGAGAKIIGGITIGDNCRIGANAAVYSDLPPHCVAVQAPTRIVQKAGLDNRHYKRQDGRWVFFDGGKWIPDPDRDA